MHLYEINLDTDYGVGGIIVLRAESKAQALEMALTEIKGNYAHYHVTIDTAHDLELIVEELPEGPGLVTFHTWSEE